MVSDNIQVVSITIRSNLVSDSIGISEIFVEGFSLVYVSTVLTNSHPYHEFDSLMEDLQVVYEEGLNEFE